MLIIYVSQPKIERCDALTSNKIKELTIAIRNSVFFFGLQNFNNIYVVTFIEKSKDAYRFVYMYNVRIGRINTFFV